MRAEEPDRDFDELDDVPFDRDPRGSENSGVSENENPLPVLLWHRPDVRHSDNVLDSVLVVRWARLDHE